MSGWHNQPGVMITDGNGRGEVENPARDNATKDHRDGGLLSAPVFIILWDKTIGESMPTPLRDRIALCLESFTWLHPILFRYDGLTFDGGRLRYVNRLNGHVVIR